MIVFINANAQTGPGGVGNSTTNKVWLKADDITGLSVNDPLTGTWTDASGNGNSASQGTAAYQPTYQSSGGVASLRFDGVNDYLDNTRNYTSRTVFAVYNVSSTLMLTTDLGQVWGNYADGVHLAIDARTTSKGFSFDGLASFGTSAKYGLYGDTYSSLVSNPSAPLFSYNQMEMIAMEFNAGKTLNRQVIGSLFPHFAVGEHQFGGDISEIIVYNTTLNTAQRTIVDNYLAAKYGISLATNDFYAFQGTHTKNLAGVGRMDASNTHTSATSASILNVTTGAGLDADGEFLLFAHNGGNGTTWTSTETPTVNYERIAREWRFDETGELSTVTFTIDTTTLTARSAGFSRFVLLVDADGDFSSGATTYNLSHATGSTYSVAFDIADGAYVTIAAFKPTVQFQLAASAGIESVGTDSILIELNQMIDVAVTINYAITGGTATGGGTDYTLASGTATILAGSSSAAIVFSINNDASQEITETFTVTLSSPNNASLGANTAHTYSINDDDAPRNIGFAVASSSGSEGTTTVVVGLVLDLVDNSNDVTVNYAVTGGTATGSGTDYTLAAGTATVLSGATTTTFSITVADDAIDENNETIIITLSNPAFANLSANKKYTYTINDNDATPQVSFTQSASSGNESVTTVNLAVALNAASGLPVTVNFNLSGTASFGSDYSVTGSSILIPAGSTIGNIVLNITDDSSQEPSETIIATITSATNATRVTPYVYTYTINASDDLGTGGPGGIGDHTSNPLWLKADDITGITSGNALTTSWPDASGNGNNASQATAAYRPIYNASRVNGKPALTFDGSNDYLDDNRTYNARTVFIVFNDKSATQNASHLAQLWGNYSDGVHVAIDPRTSPKGYSFDGNGTATAKYALNNNTFGTAIANGNAVAWSYDGWNILTVEFTSTQAITRQVIGSLVPQFSVGTHQFGGDIAEIIVYSDTLGTTRRSIVQNYLSAKYNITIANDLYSYESTHGNGIIGIGSADGVQNHFTSQSSSIFTIGSASSMGAGEYLFVGNNGGDIASFDAIAQPNIPGLSRIGREWRIDETGDVGTITVTIDTTALPGKPSGQANYLLLVYNNSDFTNGVSIYNMSLSSGKYVANNVDVSDGLFMTIATASNVTTASGDFNTGGTWASGAVPAAGQPAIISTGKTIAMSGNGTVGGVLVSSNASLNLGSYSLTVSTGDFFNVGTLTTGTSTVAFTSSANQKIKTNGYALYNFTQNGTGGTTLQDILQANNTLTLTQGVIATGSYRVYVSNTAATGLSGGTTASFVNGNLRRAFTSNTDTYRFPVGNGTGTGNYYNADITNNLLTDVSYIDASFNALTNHDDNDLMVDENGFIVQSMNTAGVWHIQPDVQPSSGSYDFTCTLTNFSGLVDNDFIIVKRPSGSTSGADWSAGGGTFNAEDGFGRKVSDGVGLLLGLASFSEFGGGEGSIGGAGLPIELLYFNASLTDDNSVALNWATELEINNKYFTIERSANGIEFEEVLQVAGAGNSLRALYYDAKDNNPLEGISYYRLKQTDFDGSYKYCDMVTINNTTQTDIDITIFPNPVTANNFTIDLGEPSFSINDEVMGQAKVVNMLGELVAVQSISGMGKSKIQLPDNLAKGMYILQLDVNQSITTKLFVTK